MADYYPRFPKALSQKETHTWKFKMSVTVFRQSVILDNFTLSELLQTCSALDYEYHTDDWNNARMIVGNLLLDKNAKVFKDQSGTIQIISLV